MLTEEEALSWIGHLLGEAPGGLTPKTRRVDMPAWDSLGILLLVSGLDEELGVQLSDEDIERMATVGDILNILRRNGKLSCQVSA
jgi:acyl carrier protein